MEIRMNRNMFYTALSRAKSAAGLFLIGDFYIPKKTINDQTEIEMERLRNKPSYSSFNSILHPKEYPPWRIVFQNVRSLTKHWRHLKADSYLMSSDILMLVETRACKTDLVELPAFQLVAEISADTRVAGQGSRVYSKLPVEDFQIICHHEIKSSVEIIKFRLNEPTHTYCLSVYRSPQTSFQTLTKLISQVITPEVLHNDVLVFGDFNCDILKCNQNTITWLEEMTNIGLHIISASEPSTDNRTQIDFVFSNSHTKFSSSNYESYYSDHKPISLTVLSDIEMKDASEELTHATEHPSTHIFKTPKAKDLFSTPSNSQRLDKNILEMSFELSQVSITPKSKSFAGIITPDIKDFNYSNLLKGNELKIMSENIFSPVLPKSKVVDSLGEPFEPDENPLNSPPPEPIILASPMVADYSVSYVRINSFSLEMRRTLAQRIGLGHIVIDPNRTTEQSLVNRSYYAGFTVRLQTKFRLTISPVFGDGNCLYRTISHILFGNQIYYNSVKEGILNSFLASEYKETLMVLCGYNEASLNDHINDVSRKDAWGTNTELTMLSLLTGVDIYYICATTYNSETWASLPVHIHGHGVLGLHADLIYQNKVLAVVYHRWNYREKSEHFDPAYPS